MVKDSLEGKSSVYIRLKMVRLHLNTLVVFISAAITGSLLSLMLRKSHHITDKFWLRRPHDIEYQHVLQEKDLVRTPDMLKHVNVWREQTRTVCTMLFICLK